MTESEVRAQLREWVLDRSKAPRGVELRDDTQILEAGFLSSLDVVELILFIEHLKGKEVDLESIDPEVIANIDALYDGFFGQASP